LKKVREEKLSEVATLFFAVRPFANTEVLCAAENAAGKGVSDALGSPLHEPRRRAEPDARRGAVSLAARAPPDDPLSDELVDNDAQGPLWNPGYNRDRGLATVYGFRLHLEI